MPEIVAPGQLSTGVGIVQFTTAPQIPGSLLTVISAGQVTVGFSVSLTVISKLQAATFPIASKTI